MCCAPKKIILKQCKWQMLLFRLKDDGIWSGFKGRWVGGWLVGCTLSHLYTHKFIDSYSLTYSHSLRIYTYSRTPTLKATHTQRNLHAFQDTNTHTHSKTSIHSLTHSKRHNTPSNRCPGTHTVEIHVLKKVQLCSAAYLKIKKRKKREYLLVLSKQSDEMEQKSETFLWYSYLWFSVKSSCVKVHQHRNPNT